MPVQLSVLFAVRVNRLQLGCENNGHCGEGEVPWGGGVRQGRAKEWRADSVLLCCLQSLQAGEVEERGMEGRGGEWRGGEWRGGEERGGEGSVGEWKGANKSEWKVTR